LGLRAFGHLAAQVPGLVGFEGIVDVGEQGAEREPGHVWSSSRASTVISEAGRGISCKIPAGGGKQRRARRSRDSPGGAHPPHPPPDTPAPARPSARVPVRALPLLLPAP